MPPTNAKHTFYTVFSNSPIADDYLPNLSEEAGKISDHLNGLAFSDIIYYMKDELFSADRLLETFLRYGEKFNIFYFSGHAKGGSLKLTDNFVANANKMAAVINNLRNLKFAFFNACETFDLAKALMKKRLASKNPKRIELIASGREVNTLLAEQFGYMFIIHAGRDGTFYDAYTHARDLVALNDENVVFREFTTMEEVEAAKGDFDFAYIDVDPAKNLPAPATAPAIAAPAPEIAAIDAAPAVAAGASLPPSTKSFDVAPEAAPIAAGAAAPTAGTPAPSANAGAGPVGAGAAAPVTGAVAATTTPQEPAENKLPPSMLKTDKKTEDILAANYLKESMQLMLSSGKLKPEQVALLNDAVDKTKAVADGSAITAKIKEVWEQAAKLIPGVNGENDFRALAKVSKDSYNQALDQFYGRMENLPVVENIKARVETAEDPAKVKDNKATQPKEKQPEQSKEAKVESREKKAPAKEPAH